MIVGCYDLHLYCDGVDCARGKYGAQAHSEYSGQETGAAARAQARRAGWKLLRDGNCLCPGCRRVGAPVAVDDEPTDLRAVTEEDVRTGGGLASFTVKIEREAPPAWSARRRARTARRVARLRRKPP